MRNRELKIGKGKERKRGDIEQGNGSDGEEGKGRRGGDENCKGGEGKAKGHHLPLPLTPPEQASRRG